MNRGKAIQKTFAKALHISSAEHPKIVLMSDCHRGTGTWADSFLPNRPLYTAALKYYAKKDFTYIELGDGDELWENRRFEDIYRTHKEVFQLHMHYHQQGKLFLLYGNHDRIKEKGLRIQKNKPYPIPFYESVILHRGKGQNLYLFHGHQGDFLNDHHWKLARSLVRHLWKPLELRGVKDPTSAAKNYAKKRKTEEEFVAFSCENKCILAAGHTHKPTLMKTDCGIYLNSGSCVHPGAITAIELTQQNATLVKWSVCSKKDMSLYVCRERLREISLM